MLFRTRSDYCFHLGIPLLFFLLSIGHWICRLSGNQEKTLFCIYPDELNPSIYNYLDSLINSFQTEFATVPVQQERSAPVNRTQVRLFYQGFDRLSSILLSCSLIMLVSLYLCDVISRLLSSVNNSVACLTNHLDPRCIIHLFNESDSGWRIALDTVLIVFSIFLPRLCLAGALALIYIAFTDFTSSYWGVTMTELNRFVFSTLFWPNDQINSREFIQDALPQTVFTKSNIKRLINGIELTVECSRITTTSVQTGRNIVIVSWFVFITGVLLALSNIALELLRFLIATLKSLVRRHSSAISFSNRLAFALMNCPDAIHLYPGVYPGRKESASKMDQITANESSSNKIS